VTDWITTVTVLVATEYGKTVESDGSVIAVGTYDKVTVVNQVGTGVVHELSGTETKFELGT
jgi:hypothetical protein